MTQVLIDRATLEQMTVALEDSIDCVRHEYETYWGHGLPTRKAQIDSMKESLDRHEASITAGRAALANAEPAGLPVTTMPLPEELGGKPDKPFIPHNPFPKMLSDILKDTP